MAVVEMVNPTAVVGGYERQWVFDKKNQPRFYNGEQQFAKLLKQRRENPIYECWKYPLASGYSMRPDFWLQETADHPEFHFEITFIDRGLQRLNQQLEGLVGQSRSVHVKRAAITRERRILAERWERKLRKAAEVTMVSGVEVILIPHSLWMGIMDDPEILDELTPSQAFRPVLV